MNTLRALKLVGSVTLLVPSGVWAQTIVAPVQQIQLVSPGGVDSRQTLPAQLPPIQFGSGIGPNEVMLRSLQIQPQSLLALVGEESENVRARVRMLNESLMGFAARSRGARITSGILTTTLGVGLGAVSFALPAATSSSASLQPWVLTFAGAQVVSGVLTMAWAPAREVLSARYEALPARTAAERRLKAMFGERALNEMAADGMRRRYLSGVGQIAVSLLTVGAMYWNPIFNGAPYSIGITDYLILGTTAASAIVSAVNMFTPSDEERIRQNYLRQLEVMGTTPLTERPAD